MDAKARLDNHHVALRRVVTTGIDVDFVAESSKCAREFSHVDVHSPAVARARLGEGRGVIRENTETSHDESLTVQRRQYIWLTCRNEGEKSRFTGNDVQEQSISLRALSLGRNRASRSTLRHCHLARRGDLWTSPHNVSQATVAARWDHEARPRHPPERVASDARRSRSRRARMWATSRVLPLLIGETKERAAAAQK